jgi:hypothetical protein
MGHKEFENLLITDYNIAVNNTAKMIYRINAFPIKMPMSLFTELGETIFKFVWGYKILRVAEKS